MAFTSHQCLYLASQNPYRIGIKIPFVWMRKLKLVGLTLTHVPERAVRRQKRVTLWSYFVKVPRRNYQQ